MMLIEPSCSCSFRGKKWQKPGKNERRGERPRWSKGGQEPRPFESEATAHRCAPKPPPPSPFATRSPSPETEERPMASSLARLGAALPRARPRAAARVLLPPGRWDAAAPGASRRAALNGKSKLPISRPSISMLAV
jgi:hypothetical protein